MSLDRYCTLRYPISYGRSRTRTSVGLKIAFVWVVSTAICAALAVNGFVDYSNVYVEGQCVPAVKDFILYGSILAFYVPLVIMVITYVMTVRILAENRRTMASIGLHSAAGGDKKAGGIGDWIARSRHKLDVGPVASTIPRPTDGLLAGRYRRKSAVLYSPAHTAKPPALRRNKIDDQSSVLSSACTARRRHSDGNLRGPAVQTLAFDDRDGGNDLPVRYPFSSNRNHLTLSQPLAHEPDPQLDRQDDVPQLGWMALPRSKANSSLNNCSEQQWCQLPGRQCVGSLLKSDDTASCCHSCKQTASSNIAVCIVENVDDRCRRMSDGVLLDYGQTPAKRQRLGRKMNRGSTWSLLHRRQQGPSYAELCDKTAADIDATLPSKYRPPTITRLRNSTPSFVTDSSVCCSDRQTKCSRSNCTVTPEFSIEEYATTVQLPACGVVVNKSGMQRSQPEGTDCQRKAVEFGGTGCKKSATRDCNRLTRWSASIRRAFRSADRTRDTSDETRWRRAGEEKVLEDRVKWSTSMQRRAATNISTSLSSGSPIRSEATNHFQMSTYRRNRTSVSTQTSLDILSTSAAATMKHRRTIATKERRASKVLGIIFGVFLLLWTPFFVVNVLSVVCDSCLDALGPAGLSSLVWLGYASSLANPIVYTMFSTSFRTVFYRILTCRVCDGRRGTQSGTNYPLSRQVTLGDAAANGRQGQPAVSRGSTAASQRHTGGSLAQCPGA